MRRLVGDAAAVDVDGQWTLAQAAEYRALRDYHVLKLLAKDRRALAVARQLGYFSAGRPVSRQVRTQRTMPKDNDAPKRRTIQTQTVLTDDNAPAAANSRQRRSWRRAVERSRAAGHGTDEPPRETDDGEAVFEDAAEEATPTLASVCAQTRTQAQEPAQPQPPAPNTALEVQLCESEQRVRQAKERTKQLEKQLELISMQQQLQQESQQQQQQPAPMDDERAPKRAQGSPSAVRDGVSFLAATTRGDGEGRTPPSKKALFSRDAAREERDALKAASDALEAKGAGAMRSEGRQHAR